MANEVAVAAFQALAMEHLAKFEAAARGISPSVRPAMLRLATAAGELRALADPKAVLAGSFAQPGMMQRQWAIFRHAMRGW